jgi:hypothetical protein
MGSPRLRAGHIPHLRPPPHPTCTLLQLRPARLQCGMRGSKRRCPWPDLTDGESGGILCRRVLVYPHVVNSSRWASIAASVTTGQQAMCMLLNNAVVQSRPSRRGAWCFQGLGFHRGPAMDAGRGRPGDTNPEKATQGEPVTPSGNSVLGSLKEDRFEHPRTISSRAIWPPGGCRISPNSDYQREMQTRRGTK